MIFFYIKIEFSQIEDHFQGSTLIFFPQLVRRTTIKQYGLVRNRNSLGHDDNMFPFSKKKKSGRTVYLYICIFNFYFKITVSEAHCHIINHWCSSLVEVFLSILTSQGPGILFNGYKKCITSNILIQNVERSKMYSLYSAHVMSCHCCMFTENHHFDIFGIEWERNIIITVISDHLSHALNRWLVYFSFTKLIRRPNGHVTAATVHYHVCRAAALVLEI